MKKIGSFLGIFLVVLIGFYLEAALFPKAAPKKVALPQENNVNTLPYTEIAANHFAELLGATQKEVEEKLGPPQKEIVLTKKTTFLDYGATYNDFLKINLKDGKVAEIYALGEKLDNRPFVLKMDPTDLSKLSPLAATFRFDDLPEPIGFELTEEDINYRPLVAFDNGTFGIFYFDPSSSELLGIRYLTKEELVAKLPYEITEGASYQAPETAVLPSADLNQLKSLLFRETVDLLRQREELPTLGNLFDNDVVLLTGLQKIVQNKKEYLTEEEVHDFNAARVLSHLPFTLKGKEFKAALEKAGIKEGKAGVLETPVEDPISGGLLSFMLGPLQEDFHEENAGSLSVAFEEDVMVILLSEAKLASESSSQGE